MNGQKDVLLIYYALTFLQVCDIIMLTITFFFAAKAGQYEVSETTTEDASLYSAAEGKHEAEDAVSFRVRQAVNIPFQKVTDFPVVRL